MVAASESVTFVLLVLPISLHRLLIFVLLLLIFTNYYLLRSFLPPRVKNLMLHFQSHLETK